MRAPLRTLSAVAAVTTTAALLPFLLPSHAEAAQFTGGDLVVYRVGDGSVPLTNAAAPVFLDEVTPAGAPVQSLALPTTTGTGGHALTAAGLSRSEGLLATSTDGGLLTLTGYDAAPGTLGPATGSSASSSLANTDPALVGRTVAVVDGNGTIDTSTVLTGVDAPRIVRSAVTDGQQVWVAGGNGGLLTTALGSGTVARVAGDADSNLTSLTIQGGQLWAAGVVSDRLAAVGTGTPSTSAALTDLPGLPPTLLTYGYALLDLTPAGFAGTGADTLYLADASRRGGTVDKYAFDGSTWQLVDYVDVPGVSGLVADVAGGAVSLAVTTPERLLLLTDPSGASTSAFAAGEPAVLATAPAGTEYRGVALAPTGVLHPPSDLLAAGTYAAADRRIARTGTWKPIKAAGAPGKKGLTSRTRNATLTASVTGASVVVRLLTGPGNGKAAVLIDGVRTTVDTYAAKAGSLSRSLTLSGGGTHTVVLKVLGAKRRSSTGTTVSVAAFKVA